jgi:aspartate aminotransferase-like enzyme
MVDWKNPPKLFIPGPVHVLPEVLQQLARPTMGHRNKEYAQLHNETIAMLMQLLFTEQLVFLVTSSPHALGAPSATVSQDETVLACGCGAFSDKWGSVVKSCGRNVDLLKVEWGKPNTPEAIDEKLATGKYAAITLVYSETSTGLANPVYEISDMMKKKYPNVMVFVDSVSAMVGMPIHFDKLGWDVTFASVQKAFAIPPGFTVAAVSKRAIEKAKTVPERGYYFDFVDFAKNNEKDNTPTTPSIPHIAAVNFQAAKLLKEGMENVWKRHKEMADYCRPGPKEFRPVCDEKY